MGQTLETLKKRKEYISIFSHVTFLLRIHYFLCNIFTCKSQPKIFSTQKYCKKIKKVLI